MVKLFKNPVTKLYCLFAQAVIPTFDIFNTYLQSEEPLVHLLYQSTLLHSLLSRVVLPEVISAADDLLEIDLEDSSILRDSNVILIGMTTKRYARSNDMIGTYVYKKFLKECKDFYIKCGTYLQKSVPVLKYEVLRSLTFIRLPERHLASQEELDIILQRFPTVVDEAQLDDLQTQFSDYQAMSDASLLHYNDEDGKKIRIDAVWGDIATVKDPYSGLPRFPVLVHLVRVLLLIPHSNAYCESVFNTVRKICTDIVVGVPQESILGPLLFNIFLCDMFLFCNVIDFASYADDSTPYCIGKTPEEVISQLEKSSKSIFEWFENNGMKANPDKCHLLLSKNENFEANINENRISNTRFEKLLGVTFDNQLNFNHHISKICKTASNKLHALARVSNYINEDKRRMLFNSYFSSHFNYCPLIWMNHNKSINKKINNLHERALRLIYCDHSSDFQELLQRDNSVTIHQKNIQALAIMMYKVVNSITPTIVSELFSYSNVNYNLRSGSQFHQPSANTVWNGQETISYLGPKIWNMVPEEMKQKSSLFAFKREIKQWVPDNCPCRICKNYLPNIGFI